MLHPKIDVEIGKLRNGAEVRRKMSFNPFHHPHRRYNPLNGEWVLVSPHRTSRPWLGREEHPPEESRRPYDPECYLCPGNDRSGGAVNDHYTGTFVFTNDFAALLPDTPSTGGKEHPLFRIQPAKGTARVMCFSPRHDLTLPELPLEQIRSVVDVWGLQISELGRDYGWVQIFENKGEIMGCSNPHPHCQIWASNYIPTEPRKEDGCQRRYWEKEKRVLLLDYLAEEMGRKDRIVIENEHWCALVPFFAVWPYETLLVPHRHILRLDELTATEKDSLALILKALTAKYDNIFQVSFPYSMGWHGAPTLKGDYAHWQLHAHFYPPLLRSATVKKFMVGYEMLAMPQRDITPEICAHRLSKLSNIHYRESTK